MAEANSERPTRTRLDFDRRTFQALRDAGFDLMPEALVGGERLDAVAFLDCGDRKATLAVETRFSTKTHAQFSLDKILFRFAYLRSRDLIDHGIVVLNYKPLVRDTNLSAELNFPLLTFGQLQQQLRDGDLKVKLQVELSNKQSSGSVSPGVTNPRRKLFVAIHFNEHNEDVFNYGISAVAERLGMEAKRVIDREHNNIIIDEIKEMITESDATVVELSDDNQNVYYEAGFADALKKPVILVALSNTKLRFDVAAVNCIMYRNITDLSTKLEQRLRVIFP